MGQQISGLAEAGEKVKTDSIPDHSQPGHAAVGGSKRHATSALC